MHRVGRRCPGCSEFAANISRGARPHSPNAQSIPGMAAGVTERLWEIGDIVDVLEAWERVRVGHVVLSTKVQYYLERAEHCERMAALTSNREVRANFAELAQQWRLGATASKPWKSSATIKLTHCPLAINPTDAVAVGNRCSRTGVGCRRHRIVGHRPASRHPARARPEVPRRRTESPPLRSQSGDSAAAVVPRPCACP